MTKTAQTLQIARKKLRSLEKDQKEASVAMIEVIRDEVIELLHQLSVLPSTAEGGYFKEKLEQFLAEELEI